MFPIGDENAGQRRRPVVVQFLLVLNTVIFIYQWTLNDRQLSNFLERWSAVPAFITDGNHLYTLLTAEFLHGGWMHLGGNMLFLWVFGDNIEDVLGHAGFAVFYCLCGIAASGMQVAIDPDSYVPLVGASGAISGVLAAYILLFPRGRVRTLILIVIIPIFILLPAWVVIGLWVVVQFLNGFASLGVDTVQTGGVAYFAHIGGFLAGAALVWIFRDPAAQRRQIAARRAHRNFERYRAGLRSGRR
jgi:membrane associated rhomboid family serine protease